MFAMESIQKMLFCEQDIKYLDFNQKLVSNKKLIGVRMPIIRQLAKKLVGEEPELVAEFLRELPHQYLEENHLHAFILMEETNLQHLLVQTEKFLSYLDNWQTCDSFLPPLFKTDQSQVPQKIIEWSQSQDEYTCRYALRLKLARQEFSSSDIAKVIKVGQSEKYYVYMMAAWYLSMAAIKNPTEFSTLFTVEKMGERLYQATLRKICDSKQFSQAEKLMYKKGGECNGSEYSSQ